jgi:hypothetical protein
MVEQHCLKKVQGCRRRLEILPRGKRSRWLCKSQRMASVPTRQRNRVLDQLGSGMIGYRPKFLTASSATTATSWTTFAREVIYRIMF